MVSTPMGRSMRRYATSRVHQGGKRLADDAQIEGSADRNADGTFTKGSEAAKEAGHLGGLHAAGKLDENEVCSVSKPVHSIRHHAYIMQPGRNDDGTFKTGSEAAKEAGHKGGLAAAAKN